jgi:hypothetical protein
MIVICFGVPYICWAAMTTKPTDNLIQHLVQWRPFVFTLLNLKS